MATPYDDRMQYNQMSSISSQTSLAGAYDEYGRSWTGRRNPSKKSSSQRARLPKIKSSPSHGALAAARTNQDRTGGHHKRGNSVSATPTSPTFVPDYLLQSSGSIIPTAHAEPAIQPKKSNKAKKLKPLLSSKYSSQEQLAIDLSRSAADNEALAAVYNSEITPAALPTPMDSANISQRRGGYHHHTTSANSQISASTTTSNRYVHPMRQTPRAYTPPIAGSYKTSFDGDSTPIASDFDTSTSTPYASLPTSNTASQQATRRRKLPHIRTGSSASPRLTSSSSQTNLHNPGTPSSLRHPAILSGDSPALEMVSPLSNNGTARSSFETSSTFRKNRSRSNTAQTDPAQQAATVQDLRRKFQEKEARKDQKYKEAEARVAEKEMKKRERKEEEGRRTSEKRERKMASRNRSRANSEKSSLSLATFGTRDDVRREEEMTERDRFDPMGLGVEMYGPELQALRAATPGTTVLPKGVPTKQGPRARGDTGESASQKVEKVKSGWSLFWFRFKTAWLRMTGGGKG